MATALLLLEIQNDYFPNGRMPLERSLEASDKAKTVLQTYRDYKAPDIHVQHISTQPNASYLLPCTKGAEFHPNVEPAKGEKIIKKHYPNSFKDTGLLNYLIKNKINHLTICGMMTQDTVDATVRAAYDLGFNLTIVGDACASRELSFNNSTVSELNVQNAFLAALGTDHAKITRAADYQQTGTRIAEVA